MEVILLIFFDLQDGINQHDKVQTCWILRKTYDCDSTEQISKFVSLILNKSQKEDVSLKDKFKSFLSYFN